MKFNITINQKAAVEMGINVDFIDLAIMDYVSALLQSSKCSRIINNEKEYGWADPKHIIEDMPLLGITTPKGINVRLEKLIEAGLLVRCPDNVSLRKTYLRVGERYDEYVGLAEIMEREEAPVQAKEKAPILTPAQRASATLKFPYFGAEFTEWWDKLINEKKWRTKSANALQMSLDKLATVSEPDAVRTIKETIENGWQGVFPKPSRQPLNFAPQKPVRTVSTEELMK